MRSHKQIKKHLDDEFETDSEPSPRPRLRVDPGEMAEYSEWVEERRQKGRKKRHAGERDQQRHRDDDDF